MSVVNHPYLPRCVRKKELIGYFGVPYATLWSTILTDDLLEEWGYSYERVKPMRTLDPNLTRIIYDHFKIKNLHQSLLEELKEEN